MSVRLFLLVSCALALSWLVPAASSAQKFRPGDVLAADHNGTLWCVTPQGGVSSIAQFPGVISGLDVDYRGDVLVGGFRILWRMDGQTGAITTLASGSTFSGYVDGIEMGPNGTFFVADTSNFFSILQMDRTGTVTTQYGFNGFWAWGLGYDCANDRLFACGGNDVDEIDLRTGTGRSLASGLPFRFLQDGCLAPDGRFVCADQTAQAVWAIAGGTVTTLFQGAPLADPEGMDVLVNGDFVIADDGPVPAPRQNGVFVLTGGPNPTLTTLASGAPFSDLNGCTAVPTLSVAMRFPSVSPGGTAVYDIASTGARCEPYVFAASLSNRTGIAVPGGRTLPIDLDALAGVVLSDAAPTVFSGFQGTLGLRGTASMKINVPNLAQLRGVTIYVAGVSAHPDAPGGVHLLSNVVTTTIGS